MPATIVTTLMTTWYQPDCTGYCWGDVVNLRLQNFPQKSQLGIEIKPRRVSLVDGSIKEWLQTHNIVLIADPNPATVGGQTLKAVRRLAASSTYDNDKLPTAKPTATEIGAAPCLLFDCVVTTKAGLASLLPARIQIKPLPFVAHNEKLLIDINLWVGYDGAAPCAPLPGSRTIEFLSRQVSLQRRFEDFISWQSQLIYGPASSRFNRVTSSFECDASLWGQSTKEEEGPHYLRASATGAEGPCMTCSPLTNFFIAYWFNYHERYRPAGKAVETAELCANAHSAFLRKTTPVCSYKHDRQCKASKGESWHWLAFYQFLQNDAQPGDVYHCGTKKHAFLVSRFGDTFTVPRKYIFGNNDPKASEPCPPGIYQIHASGPSDDAILWKRYAPGQEVATLKELMRAWLTKANGRTPEYGPKHADVAKALLPRIEQASANGLGLWVFNATKLVLVNHQIRPALSGEDGILTRDFGYDEDGDIRIRCADRIEDPIEGGFNAWKLRSDLLDPNTGWLRGDKLPPAMPKFMSYHDCRTLEPMSAENSVAAVPTSPQPTAAINVIAKDGESGTDRLHAWWACIQALFGG